MPVVLFSCETGKGKNSFAQKLANELDATVIAPDEIIWIWPDGNYAIMGQTARITIGGKDNGAFELVPDEKQPGTFINLHLQEANSNESIYFFVDYHGMSL